MKSSEVSTEKSENSFLPEQINKDLESIQDILRDNPEFFDKLIKECMKIGKKQSIFFSHIEKLLANEYPDLPTYTDGYQLIQTTYDLVKQLCIYKDDLRDQLESVIEEVFLTGDNYE